MKPRGGDPALRILDTSGQSPEIAVRREQLVAGVNFLAKPFPMDRPLHAVRAALNQWQR